MEACLFDYFLKVYCKLYAVQNPPQPILVFIRGLPGSGKSYLTEHLAKALPEDEVVTLDPDAIDQDSGAYKNHVKAQVEEGVDPKLHPYRFLRTQAFQAIEDGKTILWNQPFTDLEVFRKVTAKLEEYAGLHGKDLTILIVEVSIDKPTAKSRVKQRKASGGHGPSDDTFERFTRDHASFADAGWQTVSVDGNGDVNKSVTAIIDAISTLRLSFI